MGPKNITCADVHCLICYQKIKEPRTSKRKLARSGLDFQNNTGAHESINGDTLSKHLQVIFALRKLCDIPSEELISFLKQHPNLEEWITFCDKCKNVVKNCEKVYQELLGITAKFNSLKRSVVKSIIDSSSSTGNSKNSGRRSGVQENGVNVTEKSREFVFAQNTDNVRRTTRINTNFTDNEDSSDQKNDNVSYCTAVKAELHQEDDKLGNNSAEEDIFFGQEQYHNQIINVVPEDTFRSSRFQRTTGSKILVEVSLKNEPKDKEDGEACHEQVEGDQDWLPDIEDYDSGGNFEENGSSASEDDLELSGNKDTHADVKGKEDKTKAQDVALKEGFKNKGERKKRSKQVIKTKRPTVLCPLCKKFNCRMAYAEMLCNHLHGKCPALKKKRKSLSEITLSCPLCKEFKSTIADVVVFANHMISCTYPSPGENAPKSPQSSSVSLGRRIFACNLCSEKKYMKFEDFLTDYERHHKRKYQCTKAGCGKRLSQTETFRTHWRQEHATEQVTNETSLYKIIQPELPEIPWWCPVCQHKFQDENERDNHLKTVHPQNKNDRNKQQCKCKFCEKEYSCPDELTMHEVIMHMVNNRKKVFQCDQCTQVFSLSKILLSHRRKIHGLDLIKCKICGSEYRSERKLEAHMKYRHGNPEEAVIFSCAICQKTFANKATLSLHNKRIHNPGDGVTCELCGKWFSHNGNLKSHMIYAHNTGGAYNCTWEGCNKTLKSKTLFQYHMDRHKKTPQFKCSYCPNEYYFPFNFRDHEKAHKNSEAKPFQCSQCPMQFARQGYLNSHMKHVHNNLKKMNKPPPKWPKKTKFPCPKCGIIFPKGKLLQAHDAEVHPFPLDCEICGKKFTTRAGIRLHKKSAHEKKFQFNCEVCGKGMLTQSHLKAHLSRTHRIGEYGMHKCEVAECKKVFYSKGMLQQHMARHGQLPPQFKCDECDKVFYFKNYLRKHFKSTGHGKGFFEENSKTKKVKIEKDN